MTVTSNAPSAAVAETVTLAVSWLQPPIVMPLTTTPGLDVVTTAPERKLAPEIVTSWVEPRCTDCGAAEETTGRGQPVTSLENAALSVPSDATALTAT